MSKKKKEKKEKAPTLLDKWKWQDKGITITKSKKKIK